MDNAFISVGEWLKGGGESIAPIYMDQASKEAVFNPFDGEWMANSIAQFGPTVAMLAATFATEGLAIPALVNRLGKLGQAGKYIANAEKWIQSGKGASNFVKSARMAATSRMIEGGMEANETFKSVKADLIRKGKSDEESSQLAGDAAAKVYTNNYMLAAMDLIQFNGILNALGTSSKLGKIAHLGGQMASEGLEEGYQYAVAKEAENEINYRLGEKDLDTTIMQEFAAGLGDTEMQQAMTQGALGGAVFTAVGKLAANIANKHKNQVVKAQKFQRDNDIYKLQEVNNEKLYDYISQNGKEGRIPVVKEAFKAKLADPNATEEEKANAEKAIEYAEFYEEVHDSVDESDPVVKQAKVKNLFKQKFNESFIGDMNTRLTKYETDTNAKKKIVSEKLKTAKKAKNKEVNTEV